MAVACLAITLTLNVGHTFALLDALVTDRSKGVVASTARFIRSHTPSSIEGPRVASVPPPQRKGIGSAVSSKFRSLHFKLLAAHCAAIIASLVGLLKYALPVSETTCIVPHKILIAFILLFDATIVTFLLAKVDVTNGQRTRACWESVIIWLSRMYAWGYLPFAAIYLSLEYEGGTNAEGTFCVRFADTEEHHAERVNNATGYAINNGLLIIQFFALLLLFVRPMVVRHDDTQSGGALYKRVILRNILCTATICVSYLITSAVMVIALINETYKNDKAAKIQVMALVVNTLAVLCLIEISLRLGFTSAWKACMTNCAKSGAEVRGVNGMLEQPVITSGDTQVEQT